ncbi:MAG: hypothetical protein J07HX5_01925 [halophilic archaeon J07HX5]|nr:MAG: hypothetical protein J07HX5_01925 [halophilic archaeon J07HX5]
MSELSAAEFQTVILTRWPLATVSKPTLCVGINQSRTARRSGPIVPSGIGTGSMTLAETTGLYERDSRGLTEARTRRSNPGPVAVSLCYFARWRVSPRVRNCCLCNAPRNEPDKVEPVDPDEPDCEQNRDPKWDPLAVERVDCPPQKHKTHHIVEHV